MSNSKKRAAPSQDGEGQVKKQKKKSAYHVDETLLNAELGINEAFAVMDNQLLADYTAQKIARFGTDLSPVEVSDLSISGEFRSVAPFFITWPPSNKGRTKERAPDEKTLADVHRPQRTPSRMRRHGRSPERWKSCPSSWKSSPRSPRGWARRRRRRVHLTPLS